MQICNDVTRLLINNPILSHSEIFSGKRYFFDDAADFF